MQWERAGSNKKSRTESCLGLGGASRSQLYRERHVLLDSLPPFHLFNMASAEGKVCQSPGCDKPAKLQCPTCLKLKIEGSFFCSQECFKSNWVSVICNNNATLFSNQLDLNRLYRLLTRLFTRLKSKVSWWICCVICRYSLKVTGQPHDPFPGFKYTGDLRAVYPLSPKREVPAHIKRRK